MVLHLNFMDSKDIFGVTTVKIFSQDLVWQFGAMINLTLEFKRKTEFNQLNMVLSVD